MVTKELKDYIKKCRAQKIPDKSIATVLKEQGWSQEDIDKAMTVLLVFKRIPGWASITVMVIIAVATVLVVWGAFFIMNDIQKISEEISAVIKIEQEEEKETETSNEYLEVDSPSLNQTIESPVGISGKSNFFEANTRIRIKDDNDKVLADTFTTAEGWMGELHPFSEEVSYETPSAEKGVVEVFEESAKDGSEINKVTIPVIFYDYNVIGPEQGFCGWSTEGICIVDEDCIAGGCSGQVCQSKSEEPIITTCEYRDCYNDKTYGVNCKCVNSKCQWQ